MTYPDPTERAALIGGLRALADYLESNRDIPAPIYSDVYVFPPDKDCAGRRTEIDIIATQLGVAASTSGGGHYVATRSFGPVNYRAVAICDGAHHGEGDGAVR